MENLILFIIIFLLAAYWWNSSLSYEKAYLFAKSICSKHQVTLLDDTLQLKKIRLCRHANGYVQFCRRYQFEFSSDGENRYNASITLNGKQVESVEMETYRIPENQND
ncbi:MAG: DUF3301 domain-containing protein [Gammaproteobacteria bacterium]|nr:DUF3301 domain-containing protein [Gammaproteobacteria bacterium]